MEKKGLRKRDILRMDGLLPPTRRLPVCDAVTGTSDKKKDRKWSLGGILRRISSIRDYDSSSNEEEIVYCKRTPRKPTKFNRQPDGVILHSIENNSEHGKRVRIENNVRYTTTDPPSQLRRDSLHSRSSDGSLDGLGKKIRKNKLKARAEAKRDHLCADSSSDDDSRRSNSSLNRFHGTEGAHNGQRSNTCNRKTRAARTERYIKRLSKDEGSGSADASNDPHHKRYSSEYIEDEQQRAAHADADGSCRPPVHPRRAFPVNANNRAFSAQRSSAEGLRDANRAGLPDPGVGSVNDLRRYSTGQCVTDLNQNNTYGKIWGDIGGNAYANNAHQAGNFFTYPAKNACHYSEPFDRVVDRQLVISPDHQPPEPPPRDPRYRVIGYGYNSYPANRHQNAPNSHKRENDRTNIANGLSRPDWRNFRSYGSSNEVARYDTVERELENPMKSNPRTEFHNSLEYINNKYNSSLHCANDSAYKETEAMRCRRRNTRNDQLNCNDANYSACKARNKSANIRESSKRETTPSYASAASPDWSSGRSPCERIISRSVTPTYDDGKRVEMIRKEDSRGMTPTEEALERRRSSKNLEEALSELEAIYNSLRLGDEDLLDRAERRSMEEFTLKQGKAELDAVTAVTPDSPDRTKDDMAYRRMHPKERPTSLSDIAGQSTLSNISYLIASPVLLRRDSANDFASVSSTNCYSSRRDEPDVTRDDVVFRSINRANNTLKVIDPQPPFGIPIGPVTAATESDYLHTTPTKPEQPRSPYIPQCEPDVVTDDLAYRSLRKDVGAARNATESKIDAPRERANTRGMKKKRAVRSMSANLYGLFNQDGIHFGREPSLDHIGNEIQMVTENLAATTERPEYLRRVVSDGELSDKDVHRRKGSVRRDDIDINGNHPAIGIERAYRKKLSSVYVSPESMTTRESPKKERESSVAGLSDAMLSSGAALDDGFWHDYLRSDSNASNIDSGRGTEPDFTAYSRLCQDLVNLIKDSDDGSSPNADADTVAIIVPSDKSNDFHVKLEVDEPPTSSSRVLSSDARYSGSLRAARADDKHAENEKARSLIAFSTPDLTAPETEPAPAKSLDFYLRVADENVKLIAAAFGSVADHLRDGRSSARKNSSTSHGSEIENQSGSARSSTLYSQEDASDEQPRPTVIPAEATLVASKRDSLTSNEGSDQRGSVSHLERDARTADDTELDLSRAVRDLQLAAASLYDHGREIEDLGIVRDRKVDACSRDTTPVVAVSATNVDDEDRPLRGIGPDTVVPRERQEKREDREEEEEEVEGTRVDEIAAIAATSSTDEHRNESPFRKISLIAGALRQEERERDQEEQVEKAVMLPDGYADTRCVSREEEEEEKEEEEEEEEDREGERTVCELDRKSLRRCATNARSGGMRVPLVTNSITRVTITTCSMLLLACLLALLLAIVTVSSMR